MVTIPIRKKTGHTIKVVKNGEVKEEEKPKPGMFRCSKCNYIMELPKDPVTEFVKGNTISYTCPRCGLSETLTGYNLLTRRCFDCDKVAEGRFWLDLDGPTFTCQCPDGHLHYVYREAFGPLADDYKLSDPVYASLDSLRGKWADKKGASVKSVPKGADLKKAITEELQKHKEGMAVADIVQVLGASESDITEVLELFRAKCLVYKPKDSEPVYKLTNGAVA